MLMKLVLERATNSEPINIGSTDETTISDLVSELIAIAGYKGKVIYDTTKPEGPARKGLDLSRQLELIGDFKPKYSLRDGLRQSFEAARQYYSTEAVIAR